MRLETILEHEYSFTSGDGEIEHATRRILKEINRYWGVVVVESDLNLVTRSSSHNIETETYFFTSFYFDATPSLIDKLKDFPEALI